MTDREAEELNQWDPTGTGANLVQVATVGALKLILSLENGHRLTGDGVPRDAAQGRPGRAHRPGPDTAALGCR
jgi:hypothetical protein